MENVKNRTKVQFLEIDNKQRIIENQSTLTFIEIQKSYTTYDSYTFKQNEVLMD